MRTRPAGYNILSSRTQRDKPFVNYVRSNRTTFAIVQMLADGSTTVVLSVLSLGFAMLFGHHPFSELSRPLYVTVTLGATAALIVSFTRAGVYGALATFDYLKILRVTSERLFGIFLVLTGCFFVLKISDSFSRLWLTTWGVTSVIALCWSRLVAVSVAQRLIKSGKLAKNVAIVGANELGQKLAAKLIQEDAGTRLVGLFDQRRSRIVTSSPVYQLPLLEDLLSRGQIDEVVITIPPHASNRIFELSRRLHPFPVSLQILAPEGYEQFRVLGSCRYGDISTFRVMGRPLDEVAVVVKRLEDTVITLSILLVALPVMMIIALLIKMDSRGPVLFRQTRLGANNRPFNLLKFRSMYRDQADPLGDQLTQAGDPRITRIGRFLRRTSLDELPQLINVLAGDMSLVGPRPHPLSAKAGGVPYAGAVSEYPIRHRVKPGITGWAQVNGWRGETINIEQIRQRVEHDLYYIDNWALTFDLLILARTVFTVLSRENAM